jgi:hypothetical protein
LPPCSRSVQLYPIIVARYCQNFPVWAEPKIANVSNDCAYWTRQRIEDAVARLWCCGDALALTEILAFYNQIRGRRGTTWPSPRFSASPWPAPSPAPRMRTGQCPYRHGGRPASPTAPSPAGGSQTTPHRTDEPSKRRRPQRVTDIDWSTGTCGRMHRSQAGRRHQDVRRGHRHLARF